MKKVIVFVLTLAIALGAIGFAHIAVTESQDNLIFYPISETGDPTILDGLTAELTFTCGQHLRWYTAHTFGGETATEFVYDRKGTTPPTYTESSYLTMELGSSVSTSTNGSFSVIHTDYGKLIQAVADEIPNGGSGSKVLELADYVTHYRPDYSLSYEGAAGFCNEDFDLYSWMLANGYPENYGAYHLLLSEFRFPVQPGNTMTVRVEKDDAGQINAVHLEPENSPHLRFVSDVTDEGIWFVPIFRDVEGNPLSYESPAGHGIYFIPWKQTDTTYYADGTEFPGLTPDVKKAELRFPLDENTLSQNMVIDGTSGIVWMLTLEDGSYALTTCDLKSGTVRSRLELIDFDPAATDQTTRCSQEGSYLLFDIQDTLVLTDIAGETLYLTAPEGTEHRFGLPYYNPDDGDLYFDGETLVLIDSSWFAEGSFWVAAWRQGELAYYGDYDCSLRRGNADYYYSVISAEDYPVSLK